MGGMPQSLKQVHRARRRLRAMWQLLERLPTSAMSGASELALPIDSLPAGLTAADAPQSGTYRALTAEEGMRQHREVTALAVERRDTSDG